MANWLSRMFTIPHAQQKRLAQIPGIDVLGHTLQSLAISVALGAVDQHINDPGLSDAIKGSISTAIQNAIPVLQEPTTPAPVQPIHPALLPGVLVGSGGGVGQFTQPGAGFSPQSAVPTSPPPMIAHPISGGPVSLPPESATAQQLEDLTKLVTALAGQVGRLTQIIETAAAQAQADPGTDPQPTQLPMSGVSDASSGNAATPPVPPTEKVDATEAEV